MTNDEQQYNKYPHAKGDQKYANTLITPMNQPSTSSFSIDKHIITNIYAHYMVKLSKVDLGFGIFYQ